MKESVYVVLLNYNGYEDTINCINSVKNSDENVEIVVVDNNSTDASVEKLEVINGITFIKNNENSGFAKGNNIGIEYALAQGAEYVFLLNNDTEIEPNTISVLKEQLNQNDKIGIVGSRIMYYDQKELINYYGGHIDWLKAISVHDYIKKEYNTTIYKGDFFYTDFITGCAMLISKKVFETVGLLPEEYFMYYEDVDFCIKTKEAGFEIGVCSNSIVYHKVSASSGGENNPFMIKWTTRNRLLFINKYKKYTRGFLTIMFFYFSRMIKYFINIIKRRRENNQAMIEGIRLYHEYLNNRN